MNNNQDLNNYQVCFENSDFTPQAYGGFEWKVCSMSWSLPGGADTAVLQLAADADLEGMGELPLTGLVGCPIRILSAQGRVVWHGWVETAARTSGGLRSSCTTRSMANCVIARMPDMSDAADTRFDRWRTSDWLEDTASIARFGRKEHLIKLPYMNAQAVNQYLAAALSRGNAWPTIRVDPAGNDQTDGLQVTARGWWQRLDWVLDGQHNAGREMHLEGGKTHLEIGLSSSQSKLAQSWKTSEPGFNVGQVWLRAAVVGEPLDDLLVSLHADSNGSPGVLLAQSDSGNVSIHGGWQWLSWTFSTPLAVAADMLIWLVIERSGSPDAYNYYVLQSDDGRGYTRGSLKRWNGSAWIGSNHDLRFCCLAAAQSSDLISELLQRVTVVPFLQGVKMWQESGLQAIRWREIGYTMLDIVRDLLATGGVGGNQFSLLINSERFAEVFELPRSPFLPLSIRPDGALCEANGETLNWDTPLLGRELLINLPSGQYSLLVQRLRWTPEEGLRMVEI